MPQRWQSQTPPRCEYNVGTWVYLGLLRWRSQQSWLQSGPAARYHSSSMVWQCFSIHRYIWQCCAIHRIIWQCGSIHRFIWQCGSIHRRVWQCGSIHRRVWQCCEISHGTLARLFWISHWWSMVLLREVRERSRRVPHRWQSQTPHRYQYIVGTWVYLGLLRWRSQQSWLQSGPAARSHSNNRRDWQCCSIHRIFW
jgi:hypothetical protein